MAATSCWSRDRRGTIFRLTLPAPSDKPTARSVERQGKRLEIGALRQRRDGPDGRGRRRLLARMRPERPASARPRRTASANSAAPTLCEHDARNRKPPGAVSPRRAGRACDSRAAPPAPSRFERAKAGGSAITMSNRSPAAASAAASAKTSPRRKSQRSATPLRPAASAASAKRGLPSGRCRAPQPRRACAAAMREPAAIAVEVEHPRAGRQARR